MVQAQGEATARRVRPPASEVIGIVGRRGTGKTLSMTALALLYYREWVRRGLRVRLFSNYKIFGRPRDPSCLLSVPLPELPEDWLPFLDEQAKDLDCGILAVDEIPAVAPRVRPTSRHNYSISVLLQQIRKRGLTVFWTAQNPAEVTSTGLWQMDLLMMPQTQDEGRTVRLLVWDMQGQYVPQLWGQNPGYSIPPARPPDRRLLLRAQAFWDYYDTREVVLPTTVVERRVQEERRRKRLEERMQERLELLARAQEEVARRIAERYGVQGEATEASPPPPVFALPGGGDGSEEAGETEVDRRRLPPPWNSLRHGTPYRDFLGRCRRYGLTDEGAIRRELERLGFRVVVRVSPASGQPKEYIVRGG